MMKRQSLLAPALGVFCLLLGSLVSPTANAYTDGDLSRLTELQDSLKKVEAPVFAPRAYKESRKRYDEVRRWVEMKSSPSRVDKAIAQSREFGENALKSVSVTREALKEYLEPRDKAIAASARTLQPQLFKKGEKIFAKAAEKIEKGDIKGGLKEAPKSSPHFDLAELEAIRSGIVKKADELIATADTDMARKFALITLDKARSQRKKASSIIDINRYDREKAQAAASQAEYEARHASEIAKRVRSLKKNDQAWEQIMLSYELSMQQAADGHKLKLRFDKGTSFAANQLVAEMKSMADSIAGFKADLSALEGNIETLCADLGVRVDSDDGSDNGSAGWLSSLGSEFSNMVRDLDELRGQVRSATSSLERAEEEREAASVILAAKEEKERKFAEVKALFTPIEALTLYNASNDIVIRLRGLSFTSGNWELEESQSPLLAKVAQALQLYEKQQVIIEGHTDNTGSANTNRQLSEKRALAVMDYLRQSTGRSASDFRAIGYGAEKPVANNQTAKGRADNRRIDIVILR